VFPKVLQDRLNEQATALRKRSLRSREGIDLSSNDYLGFSEDPVLSKRILEGLKGAPLGSSGSRLLRGHLKIHEEAEATLAQFVGRESALLFPSGYQANLGLLSAILGPDDQVFSDELNHASLIDGIRLSKAEKIIYPHNNLEVLRNKIEHNQRATSFKSIKSTKSLKVIITESLFSMDGDQAPLQELVSLADEYGALLVVDESHATGLWGSVSQEGVQGGGGIVQALGLSDQVFATVHTGGKSLGCGGAWIACDLALKDYLINFSRPFIFSTAPSPALALSLIEACKYWSEVGAGRADAVHQFSSTLRTQLISLQQSYPTGIFTPAGAGPIIPVILKDNAIALAASQSLQNAGYDVRAIRPPTVPEGTARLRLTTNYLTAISNCSETNTGPGKPSIPSFDFSDLIQVLDTYLSSLKTKKMTNPKMESQ
jgi:8-amino-7-oxononanoate synthase